jgi:hypothetical protein
VERRDPILKERLFGLTNSEGNHGEDVKEYYFYLDSTPTHSYMKYLYKYPQAAYPVRRPRRDQRRAPARVEYELLDTGVFDDDRYFDVFVEYAKASPEDILVLITVANRGARGRRRSTCCRRFGSATRGRGAARAQARLGAAQGRAASSVVAASHAELGERYLFCDEDAPVCSSRRTRPTPSGSPESRTAARGSRTGSTTIDARPRDAVNPAEPGHQGRGALPAHRGRRPSAEMRLRLAPVDLGRHGRRAVRRLQSRVAARGAGGRRVLRFHHPPSASRDDALVMRQALAGMLWSKQFFYYDSGSGCTSTASIRHAAAAPLRNAQWAHMVNADVDLDAGQVGVPLVRGLGSGLPRPRPEHVDPDLAKSQLLLVLQQNYMPRTANPRLRVELRRLNPPVHAWASCSSTARTRRCVVKAIWSS